MAGADGALGLFILMHDGAHGLLHPNRRVNDAVAHWLCSSSLGEYRPYHLQHHRYVQQAEDPDLGLSAPFPIARASLKRKLLRDLSGQTFYKQRIAPLLAAPVKASSTERQSQELVRGWRFVIGNALGFALFAAVGLGWVWLLMWLLPLVTRIRNIAEHALVGRDQANPLCQARTTHAGFIERALLAPCWVNYHLEHHLFTQVPCCNLPKAQALLRQRGITTWMEVQPGYLTVLRQAAPA
jgi:fatty acid desaturase